jgi:thioredoxin 1
MKKVTNKSELGGILVENDLVLAYFSGKDCSVCAALKPKIEMFINLRFPEVKLVEIPTEEARELAASYMVFSVPVVILWVEGREYIREAGNISTVEFSRKVESIISLYIE